MRDAVYRHRHARGDGRWDGQHGAGGDELDAAGDRGQGAEVRAAFEHRSVATTKHRTVEVVEHPERAVALGRPLPVVWLRFRR